MRLLEIIIHHLKITPFIVLASSYTFASNECTGENLTTPEIIKCSQETFEKVDKLINEQYLALINTQTNEQKKSIIQSQISWIKFKEQYCTDVYDSVYPGQEASIDRISCLTQITSTRLNEIIYLRTGAINDGFHKAVSIANKKITNHDYAEAIKIIGGSGEYGELWKSYAMGNCAISLALYKEDTSTCIARMRFQTPVD
ncbi:MAG: hypothetical protein CVV09_17540 [Gammaproteobacteria bacterium HGW-Gammaproteobacteria-13]|nr:MAG: hypothetical protein CVV09_17540 [Gammaproteobacteria bacterium HGW-Gammaproteobacteria-13]